MRKLVAVFALILCIGTFWAQSPQKMSYQAIVRNTTSLLVTNTTVGMQISILQGTTTGTAVYVEKHSPLTNVNGLVNIEIGGGTPLIGTFAAINWANGPYFLKTETDPAGGTNYSIVGTSQLLSVPFALYALSAGSISASSVLLPPVATIQAASSILPFSATLNSTVNGKGLSTTVSFEWGLTTSYGNFATATPGTVTGSGNVAVSTALTGLQSNTTYHYRIKTTNAVDITYSNDMSFTTALSAPQLTTTAISSILAFSASSGGNITYDGGASVTAKGICWSSSPTPILANADGKTNVGSGIAAFTSAITKLKQKSTYYVRAYATNAVGTTYGNEISFTTQDGVVAITTIDISSILTFSASSGGEIKSDGGASVTAKGICWSTSPTPTTVNSKTTDGTGTGAFTSSMAGLIHNTTYYVRAYATNAVGTSYGNQTNFTTKDGVVALTTTAISSITGISATSGGNIKDEGGSSVSVYGICWSTSVAPTIANSKTTVGKGTGAFISGLTGLSNGTTYFVRAYATNAVGTTYGNEISFTTVGVPTLTTATFTDIKGNTAKAGGSIINDGGATITAQGLCWSTSGTPTTANKVTTSFTDVIGLLTPNTTYYVRAYATNTIGTGYGNLISFNSGQLIGTTYLGGLVFYNDGLGHGLVCASTDQSTGIRWYNGNYTFTNATALAIGTGNANTNMIVASQGAGTYAAKLCYDLVLNNFTDWYLPSIFELELMYVNLKRPGLASFSNDYYWSSSEFSDENAWILSYYDYTDYIDSKNTTNSVRAVRSF